MEIEFLHYGKIKAKERPRKGKYGFYTPSETTDCEDAIVASFIDEYQRPVPLGGALLVEIALFRKVPKVSKKKQQEMIDNIILPTSRPDVDNQIKTVLDALNGYAYIDDSQVCDLIVSKRYALDDYAKIIVRKLLIN